MIKSQACALGWIDVIMDVSHMQSHQDGQGHQSAGQIWLTGVVHAGACGTDIPCQALYHSQRELPHT